MSILLSSHMSDAPFDMGIGIGLDESVDRSDLARLVMAMMIGIRSGSVQVIEIGGRNGQVFQWLGRDGLVTRWLPRGEFGTAGQKWVWGFHTFDLATVSDVSHV